MGQWYNKREKWSGAYRITDGTNVYIGFSKNVSSRVRSHISFLRNDNPYKIQPMNWPDLVVTYRKGDNIGIETEWLQEELKSGEMNILNKFIHSELEIQNYPSEFKEIIDRVIHAIDKGYITESQLDESLSALGC